jgi:PAS domain S-box-containing protein
VPDGGEVSVLELLVGSVVDYAIFVLDVDGKVATWNAGAERLKGYRADEIVGQHFSRFYTAEDRRARVPEVALRTAVEEGRWEGEGWRVRNDGSRFWANVVITALRGDDGELRGFAKITRDLTERKTNEDALRGVLEREREAAEQLRVADRMRRELVSMVAHDLRGPVSVVQNLLDLLLEQWDELDDDGRRGRVERARARAEALAALTDDIFDISLIDAGRLDVEREVVDLPTIAAQLIDDTNALTGGQPLVVGEIDDAVLAMGDARRTIQVLDNLISNATKFSPPEEQVDVTVCRSGTDAIVTVHNGGAGIPAADQERIFERFVRLPGTLRTPGSGLGLFIARWLAEAQDGRISLVSSDDLGTTFTFALPAAEA